MKCTFYITVFVLQFTLGLFGVDQFKQQFVQLEEHSGKVERAPIQRRYASLPRERVYTPIDEDTEQNNNSKSQTVVTILRPCLLSPSKLPEMKGLEVSNTSVKATQNGRRKSCCSARCLRSSSISSAPSVGVDSRDYEKRILDLITESLINIPLVRCCFLCGEEYNVLRRRILLALPTYLHFSASWKDDNGVNARFKKGQLDEGRSSLEDKKIGTKMNLVSSPQV
ncbi:mitogen-activated kinase 9-like [Olea europaea subsp. europaea]|uniref:Mitogen-activated kinase 9-like n=1 Tax=Olea europaea subsp. europaea TaxID=158383 RepID=A0A8S0S3U1_OLEEU|nr:mitogen-activated kinase 9-like [Olea europaea subsp. europaea]